MWSEQDKYIDHLEARLREKGRTDTSRSCRRWRPRLRSSRPLRPRPTLS